MTVMPTRGYRHTGATVKRARELKAAHWSYAKIAQLISREVGHQVSQTTVMRWCDPVQHQRAVESQTRRNRTINTRKKSGRLGRPQHTPEFQEHRAACLIEAGLSLRAVTQVMRFDYPDQGWDRRRVGDVVVGRVQELVES